MGGSESKGKYRRLKYHNAFEDRHGIVRHYFRRHGKRTALRGPFGSEEFWLDYKACLPNAPAKAAPRPAPMPGSFDALAALYFASTPYRRLSKSSRTSYRRVIEGFLADHGHRLVKQFKREHADIIIGGMADRPGAGIVLLKRIRTLLKYGISIDWISFDPTAGAASYKSTEYHTWTEKELERYEARWASGTRQRLAYALLLYTGQRGSDVNAMQWNDIAGDTIHVVQIKTDQESTDEKLVIPIHPLLRHEIVLTTRRHMSIVAHDTGGYAVKAFGNFMSDAIAAAGLPSKCKAHGLRKASARRLAEAGCSAKQIQAITGHKSLSELERYVRKADQVRLARQAMETQHDEPRPVRVAKIVNSTEETVRDYAPSDPGKTG